MSGDNLETDHSRSIEGHELRRMDDGDANRITSQEEIGFFDGTLK